MPNGWLMNMHFNVGTTITDLVGDLPGFEDPIWYNAYEIENILSLNMVCKTFRVAYNSKVDDPNVLIVNSPLHPNFLMSKSGLYYHDV